MTMQASRPLRRILGLGFGLALVFGSTIGVGILSLPGLVAGILGGRGLIIGFWVFGAVYALMGAAAIAELASMIPETGGFRVYARRALGDRIGFAVGWCDWLMAVAALAYVAVAAVAFLGILWPGAADHPHVAAAVMIAGFTGIHSLGLRIGSSLTAIISLAIGILLAVLIIGCFFAAPAVGATPPAPGTAASMPWMSRAAAFAVVPALRAILTAYDGWYAPIYMAEENTDPVRTVPRAIIGGALLVAVLYLLINLAFVRVLPLPVLAASKLPAADAARIVLPRGGAELVTILSIFMMLSLFNNVLLMAPRVLFAIGRDGLITPKVALVSKGGTPRIALFFTSAFTIVVILTGTFEQIISLNALLFLLLYISGFLAVFILRFREPALPRPYKAFGYPISTALVLIGSVVFFLAAVAQDLRSALIAAALLSACVPVYAWAERGRRLRAGISVA
jgi:APA family basic amino acid/polyamine antiporter